MEFVQLLASVGVVIVLELFHNRRSVVDVGGEFVEFAGSHKYLQEFRTRLCANELSIIGERREEGVKT